MNRIRTALLALGVIGALSAGSLAGVSHAALLVPGLPALQDVRAQMVHVQSDSLAAQDISLITRHAFCIELRSCP